MGVYDSVIECMDEWIGWRIDGRVDGWMYGWTDGWMEREEKTEHKQPREYEMFHLAATLIYGPNK